MFQTKKKPSEMADKEIRDELDAIRAARIAAGGGEYARTKIAQFPTREQKLCLESIHRELRRSGSPLPSRKDQTLAGR